MKEEEEKANKKNDVTKNSDQEDEAFEIEAGDDT